MAHLNHHQVMPVLRSELLTDRVEVRSLRRWEVSVHGSVLLIRRLLKYLYGFSFLDIFCGPDLMDDR